MVSSIESSTLVLQKKVPPPQNGGICLVPQPIYKNQAPSAPNRFLRRRGGREISWETLKVHLTKYLVKYCPSHISRKATRLCYGGGGDGSEQEILSDGVELEIS